MPDFETADSAPSAGFQYRRMPAVLRKIQEINPETDVRVRLIGKIIDIDESVLVIDDGTGKAEIIFDPASNSVNFRKGDVVRVFARVLPLETDHELRLELIQDMAKLDMELYSRVYSKNASD
ncbi:MAG: hypothetical protein HZB66_03430 [Candidatus Aenigmarchaeota archaeon]|nr:hypothetical protein [Candidatus Aenigmarchaeota archaeon]